MQTSLPVPELSRDLDIANIPPGGVVQSITAGAGECALVAKRLGVPAVHALSAAITAEPWRNGGCRLTGTISADIEQQCVVTLERFRRTEQIEFERQFLADNPKRKPGNEKIIDVLSDDPPDIVQDGKIDIGEVVVETLALTLEPYPRKPDAVFVRATTDDETDQLASRSSPFAALSKLKQPR